MVTTSSITINKRAIASLSGGKIKIKVFKRSLSNVRVRFLIQRFRTDVTYNNLSDSGQFPVRASFPLSIRTQTTGTRTSRIPKVWFFFFSSYFFFLFIYFLNLTKHLIVHVNTVYYTTND